MERQEGTGKKETPHPTIKVQGTHYYLTFCPLNDLYCYDLLARWKEYWSLSPFSSFRHKDLIILETTAPSETHSLYKNLKPRTEKTMAPHSSTLAWKIPWTEEPVRLQSMGSLRVRHD